MERMRVRRRVMLAVAAMAAALVVGAFPTAVALPATVPGPPSDVHGMWTSSDGERTAISWTAPTDDGGAALLGYELRATVDQGATWIDLGWRDDCTPQEASCVPETGKVVSYSLTSFTTYRFQARAHNEIGWGAWSDLGPAYANNPGGRVRPLAPGHLTAIADDHSILLRWTAPSDPYGVRISYDIQWTTAGGAFGANSEWTLARSYLITGLDESKVWQVRVRTVRGESEYSLWRTLGDIRMADNPQRIVNFSGLPRTIARDGRTKLLPCGVKTNAGRQVRAYVDWSGPLWRPVDSDAVIVRRSDCGAVAVITKGQPVRIRVALWATPAPPRDGLLIARTYRTWDQGK